MNQILTTRKKVLTYLIHSRSGGHPVSGEEIAGAIGISRNAVWKAIHTLQEEGYDIQSVPRRGYILATAADLLSSDEIDDGIRSEGIPDSELEFICMDSVDSTNNYAKQLPPSDRAAAVLANGQTGGRGRYGRSFESPKGTGIYLTYAFHPFFPIQEVTQVTTVAAVIAHQVLSRISGQTLGIKWVNDIYRGNLKISGILTEALGGLEGSNFERLVVGIGINCLQGGIPKGLEGIAGTLTDEADPAFTRNEIAAALICGFHKAYYRKEHLHAEQYLDYYRAHCFILGRTVTLLRPGKPPLDVLAEDIDDEFRLIVRTEEGRLTLNGGEVSLRI